MHFQQKQLQNWGGSTESTIEESNKGTKKTFEIVSNFFFRNNIENFWGGEGGGIGGGGK